MNQNSDIAKQNPQVSLGNSQTGPKTLAGKKASSKNAQKGGIFTQGYLPGEDTSQKQAQYELLAEQWGAYDPTRQMILRTIEQAHLGIERQMRLEQQIYQGLMQSADIRREFVNHSGINVLAGSTLPAWYFSPSGHDEKLLALEMNKVFNQAHQLKTRYSDQIAPQIATQFPDLYAYVMQGQKVTAQFLIVLGQTYRQSTAILNLNQLIEEIQSSFGHHLLWASDSERYQLLIDGLRAQQVQTVLDLDKSNRYATNLQNRLLKGFQALHTLDQIDSAKASQADSIALTHNDESVICLDVPAEQK